MIYEVRTYDLKPGTVAQVEEKWAEAIPYREKYSKLAAFWHTDIGPLNQIIHVWGYENLDERDRVRAEAAKDPHWPPRNDGEILNMNSEIWSPAPFMRPMGGDQALGNIYEMRIYTYLPGSIPQVIAEPVDAHLALQGPERPIQGPSGSQQVSSLAGRGRGKSQAGKQDIDSCCLLTDALDLRLAHSLGLRQLPW